MEKPIVCLEISTSSVKVVIGYAQDNRVDVLYADQKPLKPGSVVGGAIVDFEHVIEVVSQFKTILLPAIKGKITLDEVVLIVPSYGIEIYQNDQSTNVISEATKIERIDISNVYSLIRRDRINVNSEIIDIIPDRFILDDGQSYKTAPLGKFSQYLKIEAKVHILPKRIIDSHRRVLASINVKVIRYIANVYGIASLINVNRDEYPQRYYLVDVGTDMTTVSLIDRDNIFSSFSLEGGEESLIQKISAAFNLKKKDAETISKLYGIDEDIHALNIPIFQAVGEDGTTTKKFYNRDLNTVIFSYIDEFTAKVKRTIAAIEEEQQVQPLNIPILISGDAIKLNGLGQYLQIKYQNKVRLIKSNVIGARNIQYISSLGALIALKTNQQEIFEENQRVTTLGRVGSTKAEDSEDNNHE